MSSTQKTCPNCQGSGTDRVANSTCAMCSGSGKITPQNCFIATATYGSPFAPEVDTFRQFRDEVLLNSKLGEAFVSFYYFVSPPFARLITKFPKLKVIVRNVLLNPMLKSLKAKK